MEEAKRFFYGIRCADGDFGSIYQLFDISNDFYAEKVDGTMDNMLIHIRYKKDLGLNITYSFNYRTCLIHDLSTSDKFFFKLTAIRNLVSVCECIKEHGLGNILYKNIETDYE